MNGQPLLHQKNLVGKIEEFVDAKKKSDRREIETGRPFKLRTPDGQIGDNHSHDISFGLSATKKSKTVKTCDPCQRVGKTNDRKKASLVTVPVISEVFSKINVDACEPMPISTEGNKYLITVMCLASQYLDAIPVPDITSKSVVNALLQLFSQIGFPREIQRDQGVSFMSRLTVECFNMFDIKVSRNSVYHPQSNPIERFHRTVKWVLKVLCIEAASNWESQVPAALFALRTVTHERTGFSPAELVYGNNF
ncbi:retrovirus-related Pol polyprotein from transposon 17.6 [Trichonephila clavipes]|nr:retrovirus-related Pol polyprotein from transposon 17.6 [Trichonephila clavipes]